MIKDIVIKILFNNSGSLKELANLSRLDEFSFYNGAVLNGLDLKNQDLRGLNFENADLRGADLEGIDYDPGAFNGAKLSSYATSLQDEFEFYLEDISIIQRSGLYFYARFRPESLEKAVKSTGMTYQVFARLAKINLQTLRKARRGQVVSGDTTYNICKTLNRLFSMQEEEAVNHQLPLFDKAALVQPVRKRARQPFVELLSLKTGGQFETILRAELFAFFERYHFNIENYREVATADVAGSYASIVELRNAWTDANKL